MQKLLSRKPCTYLPISESYSNTLSVVYCLIIIWCSLIMRGEALIKLPENVTVPGLIVFGDSIADQGNNNNLSSVMKCNFPPYGIDFAGGLATGRFTNARTPSDMIGNCSRTTKHCSSQDTCMHWSIYVYVYIDKYH